MPCEVRPLEPTAPRQIDSYCRYCQWQGSVSVTSIHTVLCPECDMPVDYKTEAKDLEAVVPKPTVCGALHKTDRRLVCERAAGHEGPHTCFKHLWSWGGGSALTEGVIPQPQVVTTAGSMNLRQVRHERLVRCALETRDGYCTRPKGHIGSCYAGAHLLEQQYGNLEETTTRPTIAGPLTKAGRGMITARLRDGTVVAVEFHHEYKTKVGRRRVDAKTGIAYRGKAKVLSGTEAKLFRLEEQTDADKPGVVVLAKALLNTAHVTPHVSDLGRGLAGGRRAALQRLLCDHEVLAGLERCVRCHVHREAISALAAPPLERADRRLVWEAYWDATASVKAYTCGCVAKTTVSGRFEVTRCASCSAKVKSEEAA